MYLDIEPNPNLPEGAIATFKEVGPTRTIRALRLHLDGIWHWCAVSGWSAAGPVPAFFGPIEESGDGPARLLTGGEHGVRLARIADPTTTAEVRWDIDDPRQWGEPFLICVPDTQYIE